MELNAFQEKIRENLPQTVLRFGEPLCKHTSFRIGGPAEAMAFPGSGAELTEILKVSKELNIKYHILGAGTNVLAPDDGITGLVICLKDSLRGMEALPGDRISVMAGETMSRAAMFAAKLGLSGLEFAQGIPGTVGGGVFMNAGAYGGEIAQVCQSVEAMDASGNLHSYSAQEMNFGYRHSRLENSGEIVVNAVFRLQPAKPEDIQRKMGELRSKRLTSQPLELPSAGSAFKRPVGGYAAALIEQAGLKGFQVGGAAISKKHAGFAVNLGGATAEDVKGLLAQVADTVYQNTGIRLEPEIRIW